MFVVAAHDVIGMRVEDQVNEVGALLLVVGVDGAAVVGDVGGGDGVLDILVSLEWCSRQSEHYVANCRKGTMLQGPTRLKGVISSDVWLAFHTL